MAMSKTKSAVVEGVILLLLFSGGIVWWRWPRQQAAILPDNTAAPATPAVSAPVAVQEDQSFGLMGLTSPDVSSRMVSALCLDSQNQLWLGTKTDGLRRYNPYASSDQRWTNFENVTGPAAVSTIAVDKKGRVWVGLESGGLFIFDGHNWQQYDTVASTDGKPRLSGPLGDHVFRIAVCPTDGAVWMATDAGLTRYDDAARRWTYFTRADGLPSDATNSVTFDSAGDVFAGTQCDGITVAAATDGYRHWRTVTGPTETTTTMSGDGLPSPYINDMVTTPAGVIYVGTMDGLAWSIDRGKSWKYEHGATWIDRLSDRPQGAPKDLGEHAFEMTGNLINRVAADDQGHLYIAYAAKGVQRFNCKTDGGVISDDTYANTNDQVIAFSSDMSQFPTAGGLGEGVFPLQSEVTLDGQQPALPTAGLPPGAPAPSESELTALLSAGPASSDQLAIVTLDDDWRTQGTWMGRYGRDWGLYLGMGEVMHGYYWGAGDQASEINRYVGPRTGNYVITDPQALAQLYDGPWYFIEVLYDDQSRYLEIPPVYMDSRVQQGLTTPDQDRRMGEINDGDHTRKSSYWSPGLYYDMHVPDGPFILSMYVINNDGRRVGTSERDYTVELRLGAGSQTAPVPGPPVAHARVADFDNGVWKRFYVRGPADVSVCVQKLSRPSIKWSAITLDHPTDMPAPYFSWQAKPPALSTDTPAGKLAVALRDGSTSNPAWWTINQTRAAVMLARWCAAQPVSTQTALLSSIADYHARLFEAYEKSQTTLGLRPARDIEHSLKYDHQWPDNSGQEPRDLSAYVRGLTSKNKTAP